MNLYPKVALALLLGSFVAKAAGQQDAPFSTDGWKTDFSKRSVPLEEILSGGPPKDGIPPIDDPKFVSVGDADDWMGDREPIVVFEHQGLVRGYPWQILMWHEIANDVVNGQPVTITYCPLCNTAIAFDRRLGDRVLDFGTTGRLRHSDLVMYDRQTESWWQQAVGEAIVGELTGKKLQFLLAPTISWRDFKRQYQPRLSRGRPHHLSSPGTVYGNAGRFAVAGASAADLPGDIPDPAPQPIWRVGDPLVGGPQSDRPGALYKRCPSPTNDSVGRRDGTGRPWIPRLEQHPVAARPTPLGPHLGSLRPSVRLCLHRALADLGRLPALASVPGCQGVMAVSG